MLVPSPCELLLLLLLPLPCADDDEDNDEIEPEDPAERPEIDFVRVFVKPPNLEPSECPKLEKLENENNWNSREKIFTPQTSAHVRSFPALLNVLS